MAFHCWLTIGIGAVSAFLNELFYIVRSYQDHQAEHHVTKNNDSNSAYSLHLLEGIHAMWTIAAMFAAGAWSFVDISIIQLSLVLSCYQRHLRQQIDDRWSSIDLKTKERFRMAYWNIQMLIKVLLPDQILNHV